MLRIAHGNGSNFNVRSWLEGCEWSENLVQSGVTTPGRAESILKTSHVKRSRYVHKLSLAALNILQRKVYYNSEDKNR